jgi:hypothetical protein
VILFVLLGKYDQNDEVERVRWVEHVARMGRRGTRIGYW